MYVENEVRPEVFGFLDQLFAPDTPQNMPSVKWCKIMAQIALNNLGLKTQDPAAVCIAEVKRALRIEQPATARSEAVIEYKRQRNMAHTESRMTVALPYDVTPAKAQTLEFIDICFTIHMNAIGGEVSRFEAEGERFTALGEKHLRQNLTLNILLYGSISEPLNLYFTAIILNSSLPIAEISPSKIVGRGPWKVSLDALTQEALSAEMVEPFSILDLLAKQAALENTQDAPKDNSCKNNQDKCGRHNDISIFEDLVVDLEHQTECDGSSDHACKPDEDLLLESQLAVVFENSEEKQKAHYCNKSAYHYHDDLDDDQLRAPSQVAEGKEREAQVNEYKCLHEE